MMPTSRFRQPPSDHAEMLAIQALTFLAEDPERLGRFLALTGVDPQTLREVARQKDFLAGVLEHVLGDERLLIDFAQQSGIDPADVGRAHEVLAGSGGQA